MLFGKLYNVISLGTIVTLIGRDNRPLFEGSTLDLRKDPLYYDYARRDVLSIKPHNMIEYSKSIKVTVKLLITLNC